MLIPFDQCEQKLLNQALVKLPPFPRFLNLAHPWPESMHNPPQTAGLRVKPSLELLSDCTTLSSHFSLTQFFPALFLPLYKIKIKLLPHSWDAHTSSTLQESFRIKSLLAKSRLIFFFWNVTLETNTISTIRSGFTTAFEEFNVFSVQQIKYLFGTWHKKNKCLPTLESQIRYWHHESPKSNWDWNNSQDLSSIPSSCQNMCSLSEMAAGNPTMIFLQCSLSIDL